MWVSGKQRSSIPETTVHYFYRDMKGALNDKDFFPILNQSRHHNWEHSVDMNKNLESIDLADTPANNEKI